MTLFPIIVAFCNINESVAVPSGPSISKAWSDASPKTTTALSETIKAQNRQLQSIFKVRGYPSVYFVSPEKMPDGRMNLNSLGKTGYVKGGAKEWLAVANTIVKKTI